MELSPTGFALLAQIARAPINAYGLTLLMRRNLHYLWPRAESRIYGEVVRLEKAGLIQARSASTGRRARRVMSITANGRRALRDWLAGPVSPGIPMESEALLRVVFGAFGAREDLLRALQQVRSEADDLLNLARAIGQEYVAGGGTAPEQAHLRALVHHLLSRYALLLRDWSGEAHATVQGWRDLEIDDKRRWAAERFRATQAMLESRASAD
jgi:DNA-binding PadR family transcriptional regulator